MMTQHDENIYSISSESAKHDKKPMGHRKKLADGKRRIISTTYLEKYVIKPHATMGTPFITPPDPCNFLRKNTGFNSKKMIKSDTDIRLTPKPVKKKDIPSLDEAKLYDEERQKAFNAQKNFIRKNIKCVLSMKPKEPEQKVVLNRYGESTPLKRGLEPIYIKTEVYGRTPKYLNRFIRMQQQKYQIQKDFSGVEQPRCRYITSEEREKLMQVQALPNNFFFISAGKIKLRFKLKLSILGS